MAMNWIKRISYNDGGRRAAGLKTVQMGDCVNRALAIASGKDYMTIRRILVEFCDKERGQDRSHPDRGIYPKTYKKVLKALGVGAMVKVNSWQALPPEGRLMIVQDEHVVAVIDGVINDTYDPVEKPTAIQGYYRFG